MVADQQDVSKPWYREGWAWFVLFPLFASVVLSSILVTTAFKYGDDVITDDYYKKGRLINQSFQQLELALELGVSAEVRFDMLTGEVNVDVEKKVGESLPESLFLFLDHPVSEDLDQVFELKEIAFNRYRADLEKPLQHRWYMRLLPTSEQFELDEHGNIIEDQSSESSNLEHWLLKGEINFTSQTDIQLVP